MFTSMACGTPTSKTHRAHSVYSTWNPGRYSASAPLDDSTESADTADSADDPSGQPQRVALSFELFPPRDAKGAGDKDKLSELLSGLEAYNPDYVSVTSSKNSRWLEGTVNFISQISRQTSLRSVAHLTCTAGPQEELERWLDILLDAGVRGFLALRGDLPDGQDSLPEGYLPHAVDFVRLIRRVEASQLERFVGGKLAVGVAAYPSGHPESTGWDQDIDVLLAKQRAGADFAITQLFFDPEEYLRFSNRARLAGVRIPLIPGIMPMTSMARLERMAKLSGLSVPARIQSALEKAQREGPESEYEVGMRFTADLAHSVLAGGAKGLHIYTFNDIHTTRTLLDEIGITAPAPK